MYRRKMRGRVAQRRARPVQYQLVPASAGEAVETPLRAARSRGTVNLAPSFAVIFAVACGSQSPSSTGSSSIRSASPPRLADSTSATAQRPSSDAAPYRNEDGAFEVRMPNAQTVHQERLRDGGQKITTEDDGVKYHVLWIDFPVGAPVNPAGAMAGAEKDVLKQDRLAVTSDRDFSFDGRFPAREVVAKSTSGESFEDVLRTIYVDGRLYSVFVRGVRDEPSARAYLESFHLLDARKARGPWVAGTLGPASASFPGYKPRERRGPRGCCRKTPWIARVGRRAHRIACSRRGSLAARLSVAGVGDGRSGWRGCRCPRAPNGGRIGACVDARARRRRRERAMAHPGLARRDNSSGAQRDPTFDRWRSSGRARSRADQDHGDNPVTRRR